MHTERELAAICLALSGPEATLTASEKELLQTLQVTAANAGDVTAFEQRIKTGADPLGDAFTRIRSAKDRRGAGAVYTPTAIVKSMTHWLSQQANPFRVVDPGSGSGRFILAAGLAFPKAQLIAVELDPLAALMLRANLQVLGWTHRAKVLVQDYRTIALEPCPGQTVFVGNPPYVRHHDISAEWKAWYARCFAGFGIKASALAGLHMHFFLQTRLLAQPGDVGAFITSSEWMDVNYGSALRQLLLQELGGMALHVLEPTVEAFPGTATTATITCFRVGESVEPFKVRSVNKLEDLNGLTKGLSVDRESLRTSPRWSIIVRPSEHDTQSGMELGELFRVHRGQVTGANDIWIAGEQAWHLPDVVKVPAVTKAKDLIQAGAQLDSSDSLRRVIDIPAELDGFEAPEKRHIEAFLRWAQTQGAHESYTARHRKSWWSVGLKAPAPILCTYMARRPPQFTLNTCDARHINIAHGLYPRGALSPEMMSALVAWLNQHIVVSSGRTYAGGLTKFEPKEIERLRIPHLNGLLA